MSNEQSIADVAVVIPVYNAQATLAACVRSICRQTRWPSEIILVNDGSTDDSEAVVAAMDGCHPPIRWLRQSNAGVSAARNAGMQACQSQWLLFLDADDDLLPTALETLLMHAGAQVDAVFGGIVQGTARVSESPCSDTRLFCMERQREALLTLVLEQPTRYLTVHGWLLRTALLHRHPDLRFRESLSLGEDGEWLLRVLCHARNVQVCTSPVYRYFIQKASTIHRWSGGRAQRYEQTIHAVQETVEESSRRYSLNLQAPMARYTLTHLLLILTHDVFHPANPASVKKTWATARVLCQQEPYRSALHRMKWGQASAAVDCALYCARRGWIPALWLCVRVRQWRNAWRSTAQA